MQRKMTRSRAIKVIEDHCMPRPFDIIEKGEEYRDIRDALRIALADMRKIEAENKIAIEQRK